MSTIVLDRVHQVSTGNNQVATFDIDRRNEIQGRTLITDVDISGVSASGELYTLISPVSGEMLKLACYRGQNIDATNNPVNNMGIAVYDASGTAPSQLTPDKILYLGGIGGDDPAGGGSKAHQAVQRLDEDFAYGLRYENGLVCEVFWDAGGGTTWVSGRFALNIQQRSSPPQFVI